jgi:transposase
METRIEVAEGSSRTRRRWTVSEKRRIVEETLSSARSLASLARQHGLNTNQLFYWRKQYLTGQLSEAPITERSGSVHILPISVKDDEPLTADQEQIKTLAPRLTMNIEIPGRALVSLEGALDATFIRTLLEGLRG